jgi:signal transduction histidine kinase
LVEPHRPVRAAVERLIRQQKLPYLLETVASQREAVWRLRQASCDAVLLDCTNGNGRGREIFEGAEHEAIILLVDRPSGGGPARLGARPCPVDAADEDSWKLLPAVVEDVLSSRRRPAADALRHPGRAAGVSDVFPIGEGLCELAHELNQPLGAIADFARVCRHHAGTLEGENRHEVIELLGRIVEQAERAGQIVRRVREFVRRADCPRSPVDLNELVRELAIVLEVEARRHEVRLGLALGCSLPKVAIDRLQIEQVVANLVHNAMDAAEEMPRRRRTVTIRTSLAAGQEVELSVEDRGKGLQEADIQRLFEPLHSGKADGMGLGLSISRSIIEAHGGRIWAVPNADQGTTFLFRLPVEGRPGNGAVAKETEGE